MTERKFFIAGVKFLPNAVSILSELNEGDILDLEPEPTNKFDPNAIKIMCGTEHVGFVPKTLSAEISAMIEVNECECEIVTLNKGSKPWELCEVVIRPVVVDTDTSEEKEDFTKDDVDFEDDELDLEYPQDEEDEEDE